MKMSKLLESTDGVVRSGDRYRRSLQNKAEHHVETGIKRRSRDRAEGLRLGESCDICVSDTTVVKSILINSSQW